MSATRPYRVERAKPACKECKRSNGWDVIDHEGDALGITFHKKADANDYANAMNDAFEDGVASAAGVKHLRALTDAAKEASGFLAEAVAQSMDDRERDHSRWYRAVKRLREVLEPKA